MDAISLIKDDHRAVRKLFRDFQKTEDGDDRQALATQIIEELSVHAAVEEQLLYPMLRMLEDKSGARVLNALEEHHVAKIVLAELSGMDADDERFAAKMHVLRENIESHIDEEEGELLPVLRRVLARQELTALGEAIVAMKEIAPNQPPTGDPDEPPGDLISPVMDKLSEAGQELLRRLTGEVQPDEDEDDEDLDEEAAGTGEKQNGRGEETRAGRDQQRGKAAPASKPARATSRTGKASTRSSGSARGGAKVSSGSSRSSNSGRAKRGTRHA
jgi:hemerythrin-like domain-containing protein